MAGPKTRPHQCGFCGVNLTGSNRAKEHVLRRSWLEKLGHSKTTVSNWLSYSDGSMELREMPAQSMLAGEVCNQCNNGWMDHLDRAVEPLLMPVIEKHGFTADLQPREARLVARWLLKTAIAVELSDRPERRHIPRATRLHVRRADWLPHGFALFTCRHVEPQKGVGVASVDKWHVNSAKLVSSVPQSRRMKFALQYDNLVIGCCVFQGTGRPNFVGVTGLHYPVFTVGATFDLDPSQEAADFVQRVWQDCTDGNSILNCSLITIQVRE